MTTAAAAMLTRPLLEFNQLPSLTLHASRWAGFMRAAVGGTAMAAEQGTLPEAMNGRRGDRIWSERWHGQWSAFILARLGLRDQPVLDLSEPALPLALLAPEPLAQCCRRLGALGYGSYLRRVISGSGTRILVLALGEDVMEFARRQAGGLRVEIGGADFSSPAAARTTVEACGRAILRAAWRGAEPALWGRAELKLPDEPFDAALVAKDVALETSLRVLQNAGAAGAV
jgi:type III secretion protein K